jgi:hypothetical protein
MTPFAHFHSLGNMPLRIERLKMRLRCSAIKSGHSWSNLVEILSKLVAFDLLSLDKSTETVKEFVSFNGNVVLVF